MSITNDGEETLRNWAVMFDNAGEITNIWNAEVYRNDGELCVIRNNGYNYEIIPNGTVEFGFMLQGNDLSLPEDISLCSRTVESTESAEISYEIQNNWGDGFIAAVTVKNTSEKPLEAWKLSFNGNFGISTIWNANLLYTDDGSFKVENDITTTPIPVGGEKVFSFQGIIASGETPVLSDFKLASIIIDTERTQPEPPVETEEAPSHETTEPSTGDEPDPATEETNETEEPVDPDPAERDENTILCFGEYLSEENSIKVYWYSTAEGAVSIHENTDGNGWKKLAEVTDGDFYEFTITEDFVIKYIKVSQQTADGMIESEPFIVAASEDGYACTWLDSDNDGLPDYAEKIYGTDPENADTDGDGLSDYDEIYKTGTNPLKYDTDEDGVNDADSDNDKDGLTNSEELALGTDPNSADTDGDSLSDYDEINKHNTDPVKADSDGDTLNDGDEIILGLDPNDPETFGVPDAEYKVKQTISADSEVMERVNTEDSPYELSLEITASGNAQNLIAGSSAYSAITESDARLGGAVSLDYYGGDVEKVKLSYEIGENYVSNEGSEYAKNCVDLQGIKRYNIFRYFDDINMLLPVATEFDEENNTLFAETDELGTYCVLDMEVLLQTFGVNPDGSQTESVEMQMYSAPTDPDNSVSDQYCVTFVVDIRKDYMTEENLNAIKKQLKEFAETSYIQCPNLTIALISVDRYNFTDSLTNYIGSYNEYDSFCVALNKLRISSKKDELFNYAVVTDGITTALEKIDSNSKNYIFCIYEQQDSIFEVDSAENIGKAIESSNNIISISAISPDFVHSGYQAEIVDITSGTVIPSYTFAGTAYSHVFEKDYVKKEYMPVILATGYQKVVLDSKLYPNGYWGESSKDADTDRDSLSDWDEVKTELLHINGIGDCELPTVGECIDKLHKIPFYVYDSLYGNSAISIYLHQPVLPINSDPTNEDGDEDGLSDIEEIDFSTDPLKSDTDCDGLSDFEEYCIGTDPNKRDTDDDGLSDLQEVELWFDPLHRNPDGDDYDDFSEWALGTNPYVYDYDALEISEEFLKGVLLGDWDSADNIPQLLGQVAGSFVPLVADARDYFANIFKNLDTGAALMNLGGFLIDFVPIAGNVADFVKAAPKVGKFVAKYADDTPKVVEAIVQTSKQLSKDDDAFLALAKALPADTIDDIADSLKNADNITKVDYEKALDILEAAGKDTKELVSSGELILKGTNYSNEYAQKLKQTYNLFLQNGFHIREHALNRIWGRINQGKLESVEQVLDVLKR